MLKGAAIQYQDISASANHDFFASDIGTNLVEVVATNSTASDTTLDFYDGGNSGVHKMKVIVKAGTTLPIPMHGARFGGTINVAASGSDIHLTLIGYGVG